MWRPRAAVVCAALAIVLAACGAPARVRTLGNEVDLARPLENLQQLRSSTAADVQRLASSCRLLGVWVGEYMSGSVAPLDVSDVQCHWRADLPAGPRGGPPEIVLGIVPDGTYRFHETERLLDDDRRVGGIGTDAIYAPQSRTLYCIRNGRLWYVQMVGVWAPQYHPQVVTSTLALRLMNQRETE